MALTIWQVDAFADEPFAGNPAAVCVLPGPRDDAWMQRVAREMNLSETAFLEQRDDGYGLRWFTPAVEVDLCGHATLASAHVLWETEALRPDEPARFHTSSGLLTVRRAGDLIEMDFPSTPPEPVEAPPELLEALGVASAVYAGRTPFDYFLELPAERDVRALRPDYTRMRRIDARGAVVTARSDDARFDFVSRFFGASAGIDEDPVTGSAHCALGPYWSERLGKASMTAYQASARGGVVHVRPEGERTAIGGRAVTVLRGDLLAD